MLGLAGFPSVTNCGLKEKKTEVFLLLKVFVSAENKQEKLLLLSIREDKVDNKRRKLFTFKQKNFSLLGSAPAKIESSDEVKRADD